MPIYLCELTFFTCIYEALPGVLGCCGEGLLLFRELGNTGTYFRVDGEEAHTFGDLGSTAKKSEESKLWDFGRLEHYFKDQGSTAPPCGGGGPHLI